PEFILPLVPVGLQPRSQSTSDWLPMDFGPKRLVSSDS
ncbi:hypothetical protein NPIL_86041, partial [Nephila pilipes]